jgi:hypothetical protein
MIQSSSTPLAGVSVRPLEDRHSAAVNGSPMAAINSVRMTAKDAQHAAEPCRIFRRLPDGDELFHAGRPSGRPRIAGTVQFTEDCLYLE